MNIKPAIYDTLTPQQRLIAAVEAIARGDEAEHEKLVDTCPKKKYEQADYRFSGMLQALITMSFQVELQMTGNLLSLIMFMGRNDEDRADIFLQKIVDTHTAWNRQVEALGIDPEIIAKTVQKLRHPLLDYFLKMDADGLLEPDEESVKEHLDMWGGLIKKILNT